MAQNEQSDTQTRSAPRAEAAATQPNAMPARGVVLLGTFTRFRGARALVRDGSGRVTLISVGDSVGGRRVAAIESGMVILMRGGRTERLEVPGT